MKKSNFAGLTQIEDNESPTSDNNSFFDENISRIDHLLQLGAVTHRHDAHGALANPLATPSGGVTPAGGSIEADQAVTIGYTLLDDQGGETAVSPSVTLSTAPALDGPTSALEGVVTYSSGALMTANYMYAITLTDGAGGETPIGPVVSLDRDPGTSYAEITLFGLNTDFAVSGATGWRLYKSVNGDPFGYYASGTAASFVDYGQGCVDCGQPPPTRNRTNNANKITVIVPGNASATTGSGVTSGASLFRIYGSLDGTFDGDSLLGEFPTASAGSGITYTALNFLSGRPPVQSTTVRGASRINAEDLTNLYWRAPVAASGLLPQAERIGEVRFAQNTGFIYAAYNASATLASGGIGWVRIASAGTSGGGGGSGITVAGSAGSPSYSATTELRFAGSGGTSVAVQDQGAGVVQVLISASGAAGPAGPQGPAGGGGGGFSSRAWASAVISPSLASGSTADIGIGLGSGWRLMGISANESMRVRIYAASADQVADSGRAIGTDPSGDHGVYVDFVLPAADLAWRTTPQIDGSGYEGPQQTANPLSVTRMAANGASGIVGFQYVRTE